LVLNVIPRGFKTVDKIAKVTRLGENEVELIINDLIAQGLIIGRAFCEKNWGYNEHQPHKHAYSYQTPKSKRATDQAKLLIAAVETLASVQPL
jgi:hypothetical protein